MLLQLFRIGYNLGIYLSTFSKFYLCLKILIFEICVKMPKLKHEYLDPQTKFFEKNIFYWKTSFYVEKPQKLFWHKFPYLGHSSQNRPKYHTKNLAMVEKKNSKTNFKVIHSLHIPLATLILYWADTLHQFVYILEWWIQ